MSLEKGGYDREEGYHPSSEGHTDFKDYGPYNRRYPYMGTPRRKVLYRIPLLLFIVTGMTTLLAGALHQGVNPLTEPLKLYKGLSFSITLLTILLAHEMGHFLTSRRHGVDATLPYFIPAPPYPFLLGTFGAFIKMRSPIVSKNALIDIGAYGPLAGFVVSLVVSFLGLKLSTLTSETLQGNIGLGNSLIFHMISYLALGPLSENQGLLLHPIAFAGWVGFLITSLNLLPIGQLDGGHIVYAVIGKRHRVVSIAMIVLLVLFGIYSWPGWLVWAIIIVSILGTRHPPIMDESYPLDRGRKMIGWFTLIVFILTFTPMPLFLV